MSINFSLFITVKKPTIVGILTIMSRENNILSLSELQNLLIFSYLSAYKISCSAELSMKFYYNLGASSSRRAHLYYGNKLFLQHCPVYFFKKKRFWLFKNISVISSLSLIRGGRKTEYPEILKEIAS